VNAINNGYLKGFPGLTADRVRRHVTINNATTMGHMDQTRQGHRSTSVKPPQPPLQEPSNTMTNLVFMQTHDITGQIYSDQTGRFPITSNRGNAYLVIFYVYDANFIALVPIKNRTKEDLLRAYEISGCMAAALLAGSTS
jgi:hypothetical protein